MLQGYYQEYSLVCVQGSQRGPAEDGSGVAGWDQIMKSLEWGINFKDVGNN